MTLVELLPWLLTACSTLALLLYWRRQDAAAVARNNAAEDTAVKTAALQVALDDLNGGLADLTREYDEMRQENERLRRRDDERTEALLAMEKERDERMELYLRVSAEHGAAQDMMMREIDSLGAQYVALRKRVAAAKTLADAVAVTKRNLRLDPRVRAVYDQYRAEHGSACAPPREEPEPAMPAGPVTAEPSLPAS